MPKNRLSRPSGNCIPTRSCVRLLEVRTQPQPTREVLHRRPAARGWCTGSESNWAGVAGLGGDGSLRTTTAESRRGRESKPAPRGSRQGRQPFQRDPPWPRQARETASAISRDCRGFRRPRRTAQRENINRKLGRADRGFHPFATRRLLFRGDRGIAGLYGVVEGGLRAFVSSADLI